MKLQIKSLYLLCFATGAMLLSSCEDFLDRQEDEKLTFEKIWESRNTIKQYWLNAMSFLPNYNGGFIGDNEPYLGASDECTITYDRGYRSMNFVSVNVIFSCRMYINAQTLWLPRNNLTNGIGRRALPVPTTILV